MPAVIPMLERPVELRPFHASENRFQHPVWFGPLPGVAGTYAVVEHETGKIWLLDKNPAGHEEKTVFVETGKVLPGTRGLLGMAFHPDYAKNRKYYVVKHLVRDGHFATHIFEGEAAEDLRHDSGRPRRLIIKLDEATNVHYGGSLQFGPDGGLFFGNGDRGGEQEPQGNG